MKIVTDNFGKYAIQKNYSGLFLYRDLKNGNYWWEADRCYFKDCWGTKEQVHKEYYKLNPQEADVGQKPKKKTLKEKIMNLFEMFQEWLENDEEKKKFEEMWDKKYMSNTTNGELNKYLRDRDYQICKMQKEIKEVKDAINELYEERKKR